MSTQSYPVLPLRDIVVFPHMIVPLFVGPEKSVRPREEVIEDAKQLKTRQRRIGRTREELLEGKKRPCCWAGCIHRTDKAPSRWQQAVLIDKR